MMIAVPLSKQINLNFSLLCGNCHAGKGIKAEEGSVYANIYGIIVAILLLCVKKFMCRGSVHRFKIFCPGLPFIELKAQQFKLAGNKHPLTLNTRILKRLLFRTSINLRKDNPECFNFSKKSGFMHAMFPGCDQAVIVVAFQRVHNDFGLS